MLAMVIKRYGAAKDVLHAEHIAKPSAKVDEVLVRLKATSVNPIEYKMRAGYGRKVFTKKRGFEFPVILGNDVCGVVEAVGKKVLDFQVGDEIFAAPEVNGQGSYSEYRVIKSIYCVKKPDTLSFVDAASIPYVAMTAWACLVTRAKLRPGHCAGKKVLVHGGSGGIGSFAIQLLKAWGAHVTTTCSTKKIERARALGADCVIDYQQEDISHMTSDFDVVLDTVGGANEQKSLHLLKKHSNAHYVSLVIPVLSAIDNSGLLKGAIGSAITLMRKKRACKKNGIHYHWGMFKSNKDALKAVKDLLDKHEIKPVVDKTFPLDQLAEAHNYAESGNVFGKVAIEIH